MSFCTFLFTLTLGSFGFFGGGDRSGGEMGQKASIEEGGLPGSEVSELDKA